MSTWLSKSCLRLIQLIINCADQATSIPLYVAVPACSCPHSILGADEFCSVSEQHLCWESLINSLGSLKQPSHLSKWWIRLVASQNSRTVLVVLQTRHAVQMYCFTLLVFPRFLGNTLRAYRQTHMSSGDSTRTFNKHIECCYTKRLHGHMLVLISRVS